MLPTLSPSDAFAPGLLRWLAAKKNKELLLTEIQKQQPGAARETIPSIEEGMVVLTSAPDIEAPFADVLLVSCCYDNVAEHPPSFFGCRTDDGRELMLQRCEITGAWMRHAGRMYEKEYAWAIVPNLVCLALSGYENAAQELVRSKEVLDGALRAIQKAEQSLSHAEQAFDASVRPPQQDGLYRTANGQIVRVSGAGFQYVLPYAQPQDERFPAYSLRRGYPLSASREDETAEWRKQWAIVEEVKA